MIFRKLFTSARGLFSTDGTTESPSQKELAAVLSDYYKLNLTRNPPHRDRPVPFEIQADDRELGGQLSVPVNTPPPKQDDPTTLTGSGGIGGVGGGGPPGGFSLAASPGTVSTPVGVVSSPVAISITRGSGFNDAVLLAYTSGLPSGASTNFGSGSPGWPISASSPNPQATFLLTNPAQVGTYTVVFTGTSTTQPTITATVTVTVTFTSVGGGGGGGPTFALSASPGSVGTHVGVVSSDVAISIARDSGFNDAVTLAYTSGLPSGAVSGFTGTNGWAISSSSPNPQIHFLLTNPGQVGTYSVVFTGTSTSDPTKHTTVTISVTFST